MAEVLRSAATESRLGKDDLQTSQKRSWAPSLSRVEIVFLAVEVILLLYSKQP